MMLGSPVEGGHEATGENLVKGNKNDGETGAYFL